MQPLDQTLSHTVLTLNGINIVTPLQDISSHCHTYYYVIVIHSNVSIVISQIMP